MAVAILCVAASAFAPAIASNAIPAVRTTAGDPPYERVANGRFQLVRDVVFQTDAFGPIVLTEGYRSNGSSSPLPDTHASRMAAFLHDALYAASGHLRLSPKRTAGWTRAEADETYCRQLAAFAVSAFHARANCAGARRFGGRTWDRLAPKRERRWRSWNLTLPQTID